VGLFLSFSYNRVFDEFECSTLDLRYRLRPSRPVDGDIVIIEISDDSIERIGEWPFSRNYHALLIQALKSAGAKTVMFDIFFSEKKEDDDGLAQAIRDSGNVYMPYVFELADKASLSDIPKAEGFAAELIDIFKKETKNTGFINVILDQDGKVRRVPSVISYEGQIYPHLALRVALNELGYSFSDVRLVPAKRIVVNDDIVIPLGKYSSIMVNYPDDWGEAFRHYSYLEIIQSYLSDVTNTTPMMDLSELKGAVCFIGFTATASPDAHPSPLHPQYPGIGVHTSLYNSIIKNSFLNRVNKWWNLVILIFMWFLTAMVTLRAGKTYAVISFIGVIFGFTLFSFILFWPFGLWIDVFYPLVTMLGIYIIFTFRKYINEMRKREIIEKELDIAKNIQRSFLPGRIPEAGGIKINAKMITARQVGGDLYDVVRIDDNRIGIMLGDVSGKGVPAALYMAKVVSVFKTFVKEGEADEVVKKVNERLVNESNTNLFVTLVFTIFDTRTNTATFALGGHLPTVFIDPDGNVELLNVEEGMPLGMIESDFSKGTKTYKPGSIFIFYSDGVTEAMNVKNEMYLEERLVKLARGFKNRSPEEIVYAIHNDVAAFAGRAPQHDDITVMAVKV
jgi:CHASE2 domain-containing sensor protein